MTSFSNKTCFQDNVDSVLPVLSKIVRRSLTQGIFPTILIESHVPPRLKNIKLESDSFSSYRPVANISFLSKVTEKYASIQTQRPAPSWLVDLIGRALHRYRRGQGFESRTSLNFFFQAFFSQLYKLRIELR